MAPGLPFSGRAPVFPTNAVNLSWGFSPMTRKGLRPERDFFVPHGTPVGVTLCQTFVAGSPQTDYGGWTCV